MKLNSLKYVGLFVLAVTVFTSCIKNKVDDLGDRGSNFIKILEAPENKIFYEPYTGLKATKLFDLRREVSNEGELNKVLTIKIKLDTAAIRAYNTAKSETFELLPDSLYTILTTGVTKNNLEYTITIQPGEFSKEFTINLNGSKWDLAHKYTLPFTIIDPGGLKISDKKGDIMPFISIKNKYDAKYEAIGVFHHPTGGDREIHEDKTLVTASPNSVRAPLGDLGASNYYMILTVNADNTVTITPSGITPNVDQSWGPNFYDPATKSFHLHYSYNTAAPRIVEETLTRK